LAARGVFSLVYRPPPNLEECIDISLYLLGIFANQDILGVIARRKNSFAVIMLGQRACKGEVSY
jgi:hypothetical protein